MSASVRVLLWIYLLPLATKHYDALLHKFSHRCTVIIRSSSRRGQAVYNQRNIAVSGNHQNVLPRTSISRYSRLHALLYPILTRQARGADLSVLRRRRSRAAPGITLVKNLKTPNLKDIPGGGEAGLPGTSFDDGPFVSSRPSPIVVKEYGEENYFVDEVTIYVI